MGEISNTGGEPRSNANRLDRQERTIAFSIEGNGIRPSHRGIGIREGAMYTLNTTEVHAVCYAIGSYTSNAWKSGNPNSGIYETDVAKSLDAMNCGYPACNQGGTVIIELHT